MAEHGGQEPQAEAGGETSGKPDGGLAAVALARSAGRGGKPDSKLDAFLEKQGRLTDSQDKLVNLQIEHLQEEQELQHRYGRLKFFGERLKVGLQLLTIAAGLAVATGVAAMVWSAAQANNLVIEAFSVPPALAARGVTGEVLARQLNDDLAAISRIAASAEQQRGLSGDWAKSLSVEIPSTGISLPQLDQWLRDKLGRQSRVSGEVMTSPDGSLTLAARSGSEGLPPIKGAEGDMASFIQKTAEAVYAREQPFSYADYLSHQERLEDSLVWARSQETLPNPRKRAFGYLVAGNALRVFEGDLAALPPWRQALRADPAFPVAYGNLAALEYDLGHPEATYRLSERVIPLTLADQTYVAEYTRQKIAQHRARLARGVGDWREMRAQHRTNLGQIMLGSQYANNLSALLIAQADAAMHDIRQAQADLDLFESSVPNDVTNKLQYAGHLRNSAQDWTGAIAAADAMVADYDSLPDKGRERYYVPVWKGRALAHLGRMTEAQALIGATRLDCQPCVSARGEIAALAGDARTSDHWFSEAVRMAPSLPQANTDWGRALLDRGETGKAIARFTAANRQGPHFADPISWWGEALLKQGKAAEAITKFAEADKYAPRWGRNHMLWGEVLAAQGKAAEAKAQFTAAAEMDLTVAERARLNQLLARPA